MFFAATPTKERPMRRAAALLFAAVLLSLALTAVASARTSPRLRQHHPVLKPAMHRTVHPLRFHLHAAV